MSKSDTADDGLEPLPHSREEMIDLLEMHARSADRLTISYSETAFIARQAAEHLRRASHSALVRQKPDDAMLRVAIEITARWFDATLSEERIVKLSQAIRAEVARRDAQIADDRRA